MNQARPLPIEDSAWAEIAQATDQPSQYFDWCRQVLAAHLAGEISIPAASELICARQDMSAFGQLVASADALIVMDYASDIAEGSAFIGAEASLQRALAIVTDIVSRH